MNGNSNNPRKANANSLKRNRQPHGHAGEERQKRSGNFELSRRSRAAMKELTPDRLLAIWRLNHPEHPEISAMLERLYRLPY